MINNTSTTDTQYALSCTTAGAAILAGVLARQTQFVEIGPVCALRRDTFDALLRIATYTLVAIATVVAFRDGAVLRLRDVAHVTLGSPPAIGDAIINDGPGLLLIVEKQREANTLELSRQIDAAIEFGEAGTPEPVEALTHHVYAEGSRA